MSEFDRIVNKCIELEESLSERNDMYNKIEKMFLMEWDEDKPSTKEKTDWIKLTISPDARNKALGAIRLLTATDPKFSVPFEKNNQDGKEVSSKIEKAASAMWDMSGRIRQNPVHYDAVSSAVLFSEIHLAINSTKDLLDYSKGGNKAAQMRFERISELTPYIFEVYDPRTGYPEFDNYGLVSYFRKVTMRAGGVLDAWGKLAEKAGVTTDRNEEIDYCDYWDNELHVVWIDGAGKPIFIDEHNLPCIPIVAQITDGSMIHQEEKNKRQPFLYNLWKSGLWKRQNLMLTAMYTTLFAVASKPTFIEKVSAEGRDFKEDFSEIGGKIKMLTNEDMYPMMKNAVDPAMKDMMNIANSLIEESTIYGQTLGEPLGSNAPYSMVALLNQAGRLPLVTIQRRGSWAIGKAMELAFLMMKNKGGVNKIAADSPMEIKPKDIPEHLIINASLDIGLPQDKKQNLQMAIQGIQSGLFSSEFARRDLGIELSDDMTEDIWAERFAELQFNKQYQIELAKVQAEIQQTVQQIQQASQPQQGQTPEQMLPEMAAPMQNRWPPGAENAPMRTSPIGEGIPMAGPEEIEET